MKHCLSFLKNQVSSSRAEKMKEIKTFFSAEVDFKTIPEESGIYIFVSPKQRFTYPNGTSKVIYIGTSKNLRYRLKTHHRNFINKNSKTEWTYSRYNYFEAFKADCYFMRVIGSETNKSLESKVIQDFYNKFGAIPVGNGAFSFR